MDVQTPGFKKKPPRQIYHVNKARWFEALVLLQRFCEIFYIWETTVSFFGAGGM